MEFPKGFNFKKWFRLQDKIVTGVEVDDNAKQFEAVGDVIEHRTNTLAYERYNREKANRTSRMDLREKKKPKQPV